jgi:hypothetical protein
MLLNDITGSGAICSFSEIGGEMAFLSKTVGNEEANGKLLLRAEGGTD